MLNKNLLIGLGGMLIGGILVVKGLTMIPGLPIVLILVGGAIGFACYKIFENR